MKNQTDTIRRIVKKLNNSEAGGGFGYLTFNALLSGMKIRLSDSLIL